MSDMVRFEIPLKANLNTDTVDRDIVPIDGGVEGKHIINNGLCMDGGVTNIYSKETDYTGIYDAVRFGSNGDVVGFKYTGVANNYMTAYVNGKPVFSQVPNFVKRTPFNDVLDVMVCGNGASYLTLTSSGGNFVINEYDIVTDAFIATRSIAIASTDVFAVAFVRDYSATLAGPKNFVVKNVTGVYGVQTRYNNIYYVTYGNDSIPSFFCNSAVNDNVYTSSNNTSDLGIYFTNGIASFSVKDANGCFLAFNTSGNLYITDWDKTFTLTANRTIRMITASTGAVSTAFTITGSTIITQSGPGFAVYANAALGSTATLARWNNTSVYVATNPSPANTIIQVNTRFKVRMSVANYNMAPVSLCGAGDIYGGAISLMSEFGELDANYPLWSQSYVTAGNSQYESMVYRGRDGSVVLVRSVMVNYNDPNRGTIMDSLLTMGEITPGAYFINVHYLNGFDSKGSNFYSSPFDLGTGVPTYSAGNNFAIVYQSDYSKSYPSAQVINCNGLQGLSGGVATDTYLNGKCTFASIPARLGQTYIAPQNIPAPIDAVFEGGGINMLGQSAYQTPFFSGYLPTNLTSIDMQFFRLYGTTYGYDGAYIYIVNVSGNTVSGYNDVAVARGLVLTAVTPNAAVFLSQYDNSLYLFDGGRSVNKALSFNRKPNILEGAWNTAQGAITLLTTSSLIMVRDGVVTEYDLPYASPTLSPNGGKGTESAVAIQSGVKVTSLYYEPTNHTLKSLDWKSANFGPSKNQLMIVKEYVVTLLNEGNTLTHIDGEISTIHDGMQNLQKFTWDITPGQWIDQSGYLRMRVQPANAMCLGSSIRLKTTQKVIIMQVDMIYQPYAGGTVSATRSA